MKVDRNLYNAEELYDRMDKRCRALEKIIEQKEKDLKTNYGYLPAGTVRAVNNGKNHAREQYFLRSEKGDKGGKYIRKDEKSKEMIRGFVQREYDEKILITAKEEYKWLRRAQKSASGDPIMRVFESMGSIKQKWITPVLLNDKDYVKAWAEIPYPSPQYKSNNQLFKTKQEEFVRSKSELLIANMLSDSGIPYKYECPLKDRNGTWALPDFTVLNIRKRKEYCWEHFGMMGDPDYAMHALQKIRSYEKHGMFSGEEVIFSFESAEIPIDVKNIELLIRKFLV